MTLLFVNTIKKIFDDMVAGGKPTTQCAATIITKHRRSGRKARDAKL